MGGLLARASAVHWDIDILIDTAADNAARVEAAVEEFMPGVFGWKAEQFATSGNWFKMGYQPQQIEILTAITAVKWSEAWATRVDGTLADIPIHLINLELLLQNKRATDRDKDREDVKRISRRKPR